MIGEGGDRGIVNLSSFSLLFGANFISCMFGYLFPDFAECMMIWTQIEVPYKVHTLGDNYTTLHP